MFFLQIYGNQYLSSCASQFGFKKGLVYVHAIYVVRKVTEFFCDNNSTVNICTLDISKAFGRLDYNKLFEKLMDRNAPVDVILLPRNWCSKTFVAVKWGAQISEFVKLLSGVRQGSVLSPYLFALF